MDKTQTTFPDSEALERTAKNVARKMQRHGGYPYLIIRDALFKANSDGYAEGHEDQMRARILDAQEHRKQLEKIDGRPVHY